MTPRLAPASGAVAAATGASSERVGESAARSGHEHPLQFGVGDGLKIGRREIGGPHRLAGGHLVGWRRRWSSGLRRSTSQRTNEVLHLGDLLALGLDNLVGELAHARILDAGALTGENRNRVMRDHRLRRALAMASSARLRSRPEADTLRNAGMMPRRCCGVPKKERSAQCSRCLKTIDRELSVRDRYRIPGIGQGPTSSWPPCFREAHRHPPVLEARFGSSAHSCHADCTCSAHLKKRSGRDTPSGAIPHTYPAPRPKHFQTRCINGIQQE